MAALLADRVATVLHMDEWSKFPSAVH